MRSLAAHESEKEQEERMATSLVEMITLHGTHVKLVDSLLGRPWAIHTTNYGQQTMAWWPMGVAVVVVLRMAVLG